MTFKKVMYNVTIILPIISKICGMINLIKELIDSNRAVSLAQEQLTRDLATLNKYMSEIDEFNKIDGDDDEELY